MKKLLCTLLPVALLLGVGLAACGNAPSDTASEDMPSAVRYKEEAYASNGHYASTPFTCTEGTGDVLSYCFQNNAASDCTVQLYKKGLLGDTLVSSITVSPDDPEGKTGELPHPRGDTFYFKLQASDGGAIGESLTACQTNLE